MCSRVPSLSVPVGHDTAGLPIGMQLLSRPLGEAVLLRVGHAYEQTQPAREPASTDARHCRVAAQTQDRRPSPRHNRTWRLH